MNKSNTDKLKVLDKQDTTEVEITLQEIARTERGKLDWSDLSAMEEEYLLEESLERMREEREKKKEFGRLGVEK